MTSLVTWCLFDGKPGHENQVMGLVNALGSLTSLNPYFFQVKSSPLNWSLGRFPAGKAMPDPDLLIGAGHGTHIPLLSARRARGGRIILLMSPSLPTALFDLCIIPEHDQPRSAKNILLSRGALSSLQPSVNHHPQNGLILIGGPSRCYSWSDANVIQQVKVILQKDPARNWILTTSRRTPASFLQALEDSGCIREQAALQAGGQLDVVTWPEVGSEWVKAQLGIAEQVWVTEESVSMVYDTLTAGANVGLIAVDKRQSGRVVRGVERLVEDGLVLPFKAWQQGRKFCSRVEPFDEATRCSQWICDQWLSVH